MKKLVKTMEGFPRIVKFILTLIFALYANIYRLFKSIADGSILGGVLAIILLCTGGFIVLWIIDLITIVLSNKILWF